MKPFHAMIGQAATKGPVTAVDPIAAALEHKYGQLAELKVCGGAPWQRPSYSEEHAKLAQKLGQLQPFIAVLPQECMGQLASFRPT